MELTSSEIQEVIRNIAQLFQDSYPTRGGKIARTELLRFLTLVTQGTIANTSLEQVVNSARTDSNDMVQLEEFLAWLFSWAKTNRTEGTKTLPARSLCASLGTPPVGVGMVYLATPRKEVPHVDQVPEICEPAFDDSMERFRELHAGNSELLERLVNRVKVCKMCGKSCAHTLPTCNSCGASLSSVAVSHTDNIFMGFVYGIARGRFPYKISMRSQSREVLCFDDPLAVSVCHLNAIPTSVYIPDLRFLFQDPLRGLAIVNKLFQVAAQAALDQYWDDEAFRRRFFAGLPKPAAAEDLIETVLCGLNCPPSMFQLHLQFIHPPLLPFHYCLVLEEAHFSHGRFFPLEYMRAALSLGDAVKMDIADDTDIADIIRRVSDLGVCYDTMHSNILRKCRRVQQLFSPWEESDFTHQVVNGKVFSLVEGLVAEPDKDARCLQQEDTKVLQNYGRPYDRDGRPTGTYYRYAKSPSEVVNFAP